MTISEKLITISSALQSIEQSIINKGQTPTGNITTYATAIDNIPSGGGGSTLITKSITQNGTYNASSDNADGYSSVTVNVSTVTPTGTISITSNGTYDVTNYASANVNVSGSTPNFTIEVPLARFSDDTNTEIGTHYMNFVDANNNKYKVILLDARYRNSSAQWCSNTSAVTGLPDYGTLAPTNPWEAKETATQNTQLILDFCSANGYTSTACTHCRGKSFVVDGVTYYGQLPSSVEILYLARHYTQFDALDDSGSGHSSKMFGTSRTIWSSTQINRTTGARLNSGGALNSTTKTSNLFVAPVLEIPF